MNPPFLPLPEITGAFQLSLTIRATLALTVLIIFGLMFVTPTSPLPNGGSVAVSRH